MSWSKSFKISICVVSVVFALTIALHFIEEIGFSFINEDWVIRANRVIGFIGYVCIASCLISIVAISKIYRGFRYSYYHTKIRHNLKKELEAAKFYIDESKSIPLFKITFIDRACKKGRLYIKNSIKLEKRFKEVNVSSALGKYICTNTYFSKNRNHIICEFKDMTSDIQLEFKSIDEFLRYQSKMPKYTLFVDQETKLPLSNILLTGTSRSGKSYFSYSIIAQLALMRSTLYFIDSKGQGVAHIGNILAPENTGVEFDEIMDILRSYNNLMMVRNKQVASLLGDRIDGDWRTVGLKPCYLICEELSAFLGIAETKGNSTKKEIDGILANIAQMGMQSGCMIVIIAQQARADLIKTNIREQLSTVFMMGRSYGASTAEMCFGKEGAKQIPNIWYTQGEGVLTCDNINVILPKYFKSPNLDINTDIGRLFVEIRDLNEALETAGKRSEASANLSVVGDR